MLFKYMLTLKVMIFNMLHQTKTKHADKIKRSEKIIFISL